MQFTAQKAGQPVSTACSLLRRHLTEYVYWPENVIDWVRKWRPTCVMRHARGQKLQSFRRKWPFYMDLYSMPVARGALAPKIHEECQNARPFIQTTKSWFSKVFIIGPLATFHLHGIHIPYEDSYSINSLIPWCFHGFHLHSIDILYEDCYS